MSESKLPALPRSQAIPRSWRSLDWSSLFAVAIYPALGLVGLIAAVVLGLALPGAGLAWWYAPLALGAFGLTVFLCNQGIGPLHRIWQHKAGHLRAPAQLWVILNCVLAMQGKITDWVNYHAQHHRLSDQPGDPHNPHEGWVWAWFGWLLWRDPDDLKRPMANWLGRLPLARFCDRHYHWLVLVIHVGLPALFYGAFIVFGGPLVLALMMHASAVLGRAVQFHATTLGVNVVGHLKAPRWVVWLLAVFTGGEAFHVHHHDFPRSALHLPKNGLLNRLVDYNGTVLLVLKKLRLASDLHIAPQFLPARARQDG